MTAAAHELAPVLANPALHAFTGGEPATEDGLRERHDGEVRRVGS